MMEHPGGCGGLYQSERGAGIGASHQTGWAGLAARAMQLRGLTAESILHSTTTQEAFASMSKSAA
jgi:phosphohistidine swiveling domain-containing protein